MAPYCTGEHLFFRSDDDDTTHFSHNLNYHDSVVASVPLHEVAGEDKVPSYVADTKAVRCSLESKGHSRSGGIGVERGKFEQVRSPTNSPTSRARFSGKKFRKSWPA